MESKGYNGWTNYETWAVNLWIDNEEGSSRYWDEAAKECYSRSEANAVMTRDEMATIALADMLKEWLEEAGEATGVEGMMSDLLGSAIGAVEFYEIAKHKICDAEKVGS